MGELRRSAGEFQKNEEKIFERYSSVKEKNSYNRFSEIEKDFTEPGGLRVVGWEG